MSASITLMIITIILEKFKGFFFSIKVQRGSGGTKFQWHTLLLGMHRILTMAKDKPSLLLYFSVLESYNLKQFYIIFNTNLLLLMIKTTDP